MKINQDLSASSLYEIVRTGFGEVTDHRTEGAEISLQDILMSGFALFSLKDPSLLAFDARREEPENLHRVYGIEQIACDRKLGQSRTWTVAVLKCPITIAVVCGIDILRIRFNGF